MANIVINPILISKLTESRVPDDIVEEKWLISLSSEEKKLSAIRGLYLVVKQDNNLSITRRR
jgi:hypothetical protein